MHAFSEAFEELDPLQTRMWENKRLQLGTIAVWQWHQISGRLWPIWIHDEAGEAGEAAARMGETELGGREQRLQNKDEESEPAPTVAQAHDIVT